jgi:hypothetical protein
MSRTQQQQVMLCQLLKTPAGREKLTDALVRSLERRKNVNIGSLSQTLREENGEEYAIWAEQCLVEAAERANALILDTAPKVTGTLGIYDEHWMLQTEDGRVYFLKEPDHLTVYDSDDDVYWSGTLFDALREKQEETLSIPLRKGWRAVLARRDLTDYATI